MERYNLKGKNVQQKDFMKVIKDLCGFKKQKDMGSVEDIFIKQRKITEMKKMQHYGSLLILILLKKTKNEIKISDINQLITN